MLTPIISIIKIQRVRHFIFERYDMRQEKYTIRFTVLAEKIHLKRNPDAVHIEIS